MRQGRAKSAPESAKRASSKSSKASEETSRSKKPNRSKIRTSCTRIWPPNFRTTSKLSKTNFKSKQIWSWSVKIVVSVPTCPPSKIVRAFMAAQSVAHSPTQGPGLSNHRTRSTGTWPKLSLKRDCQSHLRRIRISHLISQLRRPYRPKL